MEEYKTIIELAPVIIVILMVIWRNNVFVRPEHLEEKHRCILSEVDEKIEKKIRGRYVEVTAYKEFQNRVYSELEKVNGGINDLKEFLMKG